MKILIILLCLILGQIFIHFDLHQRDQLTVIDHLKFEITDKRTNKRTDSLINISQEIVSNWKQL